MELLDLENNKIIDAVKLIKSAVLKSQAQVALDGNKIQLSLYFGIGKYISENTRNNYWGMNSIEKISNQLQKEMPGLRGFSSTNLKNMRTFFEEWNADLNRQSLTDDLNNSADKVLPEKYKRVLPDLNAMRNLLASKKNDLGKDDV